MQQAPPTDDSNAGASEKDNHDLGRSDTSNRERPEQPESARQSAQERRRTGEHPVGNEQAAANRAEEPPA